MIRNVVSAILLSLGFLLVLPHAAAADPICVDVRVPIPPPVSNVTGPGPYGATVCQPG